jgi:hypothetical protein
MSLFSDVIIKGNIQWPIYVENQLVNLEMV